MFKIGMFNKDNIEKHVEEFISYEGHLPYLIIAVLDFNQTGQRIEHLKKISETTYEKEWNLLKSERRNYDKKIEALKSFLIENPNFQDILPKQHLKELLEN